MILTGYNVRLERLTHEKIELVRQMRNMEKIVRHMEYREYITPEMQEKWFRSIDNTENHYYIISSGEKEVGLINGCKVNWKKKETGSGGIFIWDDEVLRTEIPLAASLLLTDTSFYLGLERTYVKILRDNAAAISYNHNLGYELLPGQENSVNQEYVLTQENYEAKTKKIKEIFHRKWGDRMTIIFDNPEHPVTRFLEEKIRALPEQVLAHLELITPGR
ncbi:MAG TPA: hypothetical protein VFU15_15455 [Bacteroidia bacterium]|nr:hypothetical protein [Bacteroidia bacterium]